MFLEMLTGLVAGVTSYYGLSYVNNNYPVIYQKSVDTIVKIRDSFTKTVLAPFFSAEVADLKIRVSVLEDHLHSIASAWETANCKASDGYALSEPPRLDKIMKDIRSKIPETAELREQRRQLEQAVRIIQQTREQNHENDTKVLDNILPLHMVRPYVHEPIIAHA